MRLEFWKYWVFNDPAWDWRTFDYDRDVSYADAKVAAVNASNPDLSAFKARGGKILMYSGWADPTGPPMDAVNYYERVEKVMGGGRTQSLSFDCSWCPEWHTASAGPGRISLETLLLPRRSQSTRSTMCLVRLRNGWKKDWLPTISLRLT